MKSWKVILATLVIFGAGFFAGALVVKNSPAKVVVTPPPPQPMPGGFSQLQDRMKRELKLSPEQTTKLESIFKDSNERIKILWNLVGPEMKIERTNVLEKVRTVLTDDQKKKFEELLKPQSHRGFPMQPGGGWHPPRDRRSSTNARPSGPFKEPSTNSPALRPTP